jgi:hypothetical protein
MANTILLFRELTLHSPHGPVYRLANRRLITECQLSGLEPFKLRGDVGQAQVSGPNSVIAGSLGFLRAARGPDSSQTAPLSPRLRRVATGAQRHPGGFGRLTAPSLAEDG